MRHVYRDAVFCRGPRFKAGDVVRTLCSPHAGSTGVVLYTFSSQLGGSFIYKVSVPAGRVGRTYFEDELEASR